MRAAEQVTILCAATGPSLTSEDLQAMRGHFDKAIGVNDAYRYANFFDVIYAADGKWWDYHIDNVRATTSATLLTQDDAAYKRHSLNFIPSLPNPGLARKGWQLHRGGNSGYQAINLAYQLGATTILLLGYDFCVGEDGERHCFGEHPQGLVRTKPERYKQWAAMMRLLADDLVSEGVKVINLSRRSILDCFERLTIEDYTKGES